MKKMNRKGFTIVELVIVIAVIAILAGVLIPTFSGIVTKANESKALQEARNAYTETLADDLTNAADADDVVYNFGSAIIVKHSNGTYISISTNGEATVATGKTDSDITHTYNTSTKKLEAN